MALILIVIILIAIKQAKGRKLGSKAKQGHQLRQRRRPRPNRCTRYASQFAYNYENILIYSIKLLECAQKTLGTPIFSIIRKSKLNILFPSFKSILQNTLISSILKIMSLVLKLRLLETIEQVRNQRYHFLNIRQVLSQKSQNFPYVSMIWHNKLESIKLQLRGLRLPFKIKVQTNKPKKRDLAQKSEVGQARPMRPLFWSILREPCLKR